MTLNFSIKIAIKASVRRESNSVWIQTVSMLCCKRPDHSYIPTKSPGVSQSWKKVSRTTPTSTRTTNDLRGSDLRSGVSIPIYNVSKLHASVNGTYVQLRNNRVLTPPRTSIQSEHLYEEISNSETSSLRGVPLHAFGRTPSISLESFASTNFSQPSESLQEDSQIHSYVNIGETKRRPSRATRAKRKLNFDLVDSCQEQSSHIITRSYTSVETQTWDRYQTSEERFQSFETTLSSIAIQIEQLRGTVQSSLTISALPIEPLFSY